MQRESDLRIGRKAQTQARPDARSRRLRSGQLPRPERPQNGRRRGRRSLHPLGQLQLGRHALLQEEHADLLPRCLRLAGSLLVCRSGGQQRPVQPAGGQVRPVPRSGRQERRAEQESGDADPPHGKQRRGLQHLRRRAAPHLPCQETARRSRVGDQKVPRPGASLRRPAVGAADGAEIPGEDEEPRVLSQPGSTTCS